MIAVRTTWGRRMLSTHTDQQFLQTQPFCPLFIDWAWNRSFLPVRPSAPIAANYLWWSFEEHTRFLSERIKKEANFYEKQTDKRCSWCESFRPRLRTRRGLSGT